MTHMRKAKNIFLIVGWLAFWSGLCDMLANRLTDSNAVFILAGSIAIIIGYILKIIMFVRRYY